MNLRQLASRMICAGFDGLGVPADVQALLREGLGGVVLFARNVGSPTQVRELIHELKQTAPAGLLVCVDQEGGRVARCREGFVKIPSMRRLGQTGDVALARDVGRVIGTELRAVGFDLDFAPVLDVDTNPANPVIADRSLGRDPAAVAAMGAALIEGLQSSGVAACGKHFPGHGDTAKDSHLDLPILPHDLGRLHSVELMPFQAAIRAGVGAIMTSHILFPALDANRPATMSPAILRDLLRDQLGFDGVIVSDDLEMHAIARHFDFRDAVVGCVQAGVDLLCIAHALEKQRAAIDAIVTAVERGQIELELLVESNRRLDRLFERFGRAAERRELDLLDCPTHRQVMARAGLAEVQSPDPTERWRND